MDSAKHPRDHAAAAAAAAAAELSEPLTLFLEALLADACSVRVVADNFRGLPEEDAESYHPPPPSERISNTSSSIPELCRWASNSGGQRPRHVVMIEAAASMDSDNGYDYDSDLDDEFQFNGGGSSSNNLDISAPRAPRRRTSLDSEEDGGDHDYGWLSSSSSSSEEEFTAAAAALHSPTSWERKFAALQDSILFEQPPSDPPESQHSRDNLNDPPKAPQRQNSLLRMDHNSDHSSKGVRTNISLPDEDQLETVADSIQKVHKRRYGVSFLASADPLSSMLSQSASSTMIVGGESPSMVLEKIHREVCIREDDIDIEGAPVSSPMFCAGSDEERPLCSSSERRSGKQDCSPCCARRRPSPQLEKTLSETSFAVTAVSAKARRRPSPQLEKTLSETCSKAPVSAKRRPSPQLECDKSLCDSLESSPVRAKRRPSPEHETFSNLVEALGGAGLGSPLTEPKDEGAPEHQQRSSLKQ